MVGPDVDVGLVGGDNSSIFHVIRYLGKPCHTVYRVLSFAVTLSTFLTSATSK